MSNFQPNYFYDLPEELQKHIFLISHAKIVIYRNLIAFSIARQSFRMCLYYFEQWNPERVSVKTTLCPESEVCEEDNAIFELDKFSVMEYPRGNMKHRCEMLKHPAFINFKASISKPFLTDSRNFWCHMSWNMDMHSDDVDMGLDGQGNLTLDFTRHILVGHGVFKNGRVFFFTALEQLHDQLWDW